MNISEVAATTAGHQDLPADLSRVLKHQYGSTPIACRSSTHQTGSTGSYNNHINLLQGNYFPLKKETHCTQSDRF